MAIEGSPAEAKPLDPAYPFDSAGQSVLLHRGDIHGLTPTPRQGEIELTLWPKPDLRWRIEAEPDDHIRSATAFDCAEMRISRHGRSQTIPILRTSIDGGLINQVELSSEEPHPVRFLVHWLNLPSILGSALKATRGQHTYYYSGRWKTEIADLVITMDAQPGQADAAKRAETSHVYILTHVMEVRRRDGGILDTDRVNRIVEWLRVSFSFGFGRWVSPVIQVGFDRDDAVVYESWKSPICEPYRSTNSGWLYQGRLSDVNEFITKMMAVFDNASKADITRFQLLFCTDASKASSFLEQRLMSAFSAIENLEWTMLVLSGRIPERDYKSTKWPGDARLRKALNIARIDNSIDSAALPALARFAKLERLKDGPAAIVRVRNRLVHPKRLRQEVYHLDGLVRDTWLLARYYAILLILYSVNYRGSYQRLLPPCGWVGEVELVPWAQ